MPAGMDYGRRSANKRKEVYTMDVRKMRNAALGKRVVAALESRNMEAYYVETKEEALKKGT